MLNSIYNPIDFQENDEPLTIGEGDTRYLKLIGGTVTGATNFNQTFSQPISAPSITPSSNINSQTANQVGYYKSFVPAITGGSIQNGTVSTPSFNTVSLAAGVWVISYYHNISFTASINFTQIQHGVTTSSSGVYIQTSSQSSFASETMASGSRYCSGTYIVRPSATTSYYAPILIAYSTSGTITINMGINAIRIA